MRTAVWVGGLLLTGASLMAAYHHRGGTCCPLSGSEECAPPSPLPAELVRADECPPAACATTVVPTSYRLDEPPLADETYLRPAVFAVPAAPPTGGAPAVMPLSRSSFYEPPGLLIDPLQQEQHPGVVPTIVPAGFSTPAVPIPLQIHWPWMMWGLGL